ncbi:MAG: hypothetical protein R2855_12295 [Thermomicrobiales bacterium]
MPWRESSDRTCWQRKARQDPVEQFVQEMNATAEYLGLQNTHFTNAAGLYAARITTTARDLAIIASHAFAVPQIAQASSVPTYTLTTQRRESPRNDAHQHKQDLSGQDGVIGGKTGTLMESGACLVVLLDEGNGNMVIGVVLGSDIEFDEDQVQIAETDMRFDDMSTVIGAMNESYRWVQPGDAAFPGTHKNWRFGTSG